MGDRTSVTLRVLASQAEQTEAFTEGEKFEFRDGEECSELIFNGVNYGELWILDDLKNAGIAYDSEWGHGGNYGPGTASCRFTAEGEAIEKSISDDNLNPDIYELLKLIDEPAVLRQFILDHEERTSTLSWDNQEEYGKLYQTKKLISS